MKKLLVTLGVTSVVFASAVFAQDASLESQENLDTGIWWNAMENMDAVIAFSEENAYETLLSLASGSEAGAKLSADQVAMLVKGDERGAVLNIKDLLQASLDGVVAGAESVDDAQGSENHILENYVQEHPAHYLVCGSVQGVNGVYVRCTVESEPGLDGVMLS